MQALRELAEEIRANPSERERWAEDASEEEALSLADELLSLVDGFDINSLPLHARKLVIDALLEDADRCYDDGDDELAASADLLVGIASQIKTT